MSEVDLKAEVEKAQEHKYNETEVQAMEEGWIPPERAGELPEGKKHLSAEEYLERGTFFKKIDTLKKKVEDQDKTINHLASHYEKVVESERAKVQREMKAEIERLKAEKIEALDQGNSARVVEIDEEIQEVRQVSREPQAEHPVFAKWKQENEWYLKDEFLHDEAEILGSEYARKRIPIDQALSKITNHLKTKYPDRFDNPERKLPPSVEGGTPPPPKGKTITEKDLTREEREVFKNFERNGVIKTDADRARYFKQVMDLRD